MYKLKLEYGENIELNFKAGNSYAQINLPKDIFDKAVCLGDEGLIEFVEEVSKKAFHYGYECGRRDCKEQMIEILNMSRRG